jgi:periplasmic divalent cation tolerance protein
MQSTNQSIPVILPERFPFVEEPPMSQAVQVATTTASKSDAERIARALIEQRLAACVQISGPITSVYRWQDAIETATEWLCTIKTIESNYPQVETTIRQLHTYDEPEIIAVAIVAGSASYLEWLRAESGFDS